MHSGLFAAALVACGLLVGSALPAQTRAPAGPPGRVAPPTADAIRNGEAIFRARCAGCHGLDARGLTGPDLTGLWAAGLADEQLFQIVRLGVPGSEMPPFDSRSQVDEIRETLAYLRTLNLPEVGPQSTVGDAVDGRRLFERLCRSCHAVHGEGGLLGPDLSRIGSARPRGALIDKIRTGGRMRDGYETVTLVTTAGERIRGIRKNEDDFSIQIMDARERLRGYLRRDLVELVYEPRSLMPAYGAAQVSERELDDLLGYLGTLKVRTESR